MTEEQIFEELEKSWESECREKGFDKNDDIVFGAWLQGKYVRLLLALDKLLKQEKEK